MNLDVKDLGLKEIDQVDASQVNGGFGLIFLEVVAAAAVGVLFTAAYEAGKAAGRR